jgi:hypothetical protein
MWSSGEVVVLRYLHEGRVSRILPANVVRDEPASVQLYLRAGTPIRVRATLDGTPIARTLPYAERFRLPWRLGASTWEGNHTLKLVPVGAAHAFLAHWSETWEFRGFYVNLQDPLRRTRLGFDTADHVLDLVIDGTGWRWKDEDELAEAVGAGRFSREEAAALYREGERAIAAYESGAWPFDRDWSGWRADPAWPEPRIADGSEEP